ncbi:MAG: glycosyltransferase family 9 protein [Bacteroidales bacterium]|nr:glycosyltransferase family 9 protein [Bacteroidales bacterium]
MDELQPPSQPKILVIRLSSIGDIVLTTPIVRAIKTQVEGGAFVHYLTKEANVPVIKPNPYIDKIHVYNSADLPSLIRELAVENFDVIIDLHNNHRSRQVIRHLKVPHFTYRKYTFRRDLCVALKLNFMPDEHIVNRYFQAVFPIDVQNDHKGLDFVIPEGADFDEEDLPMVFEDGFVAVVLAGAHATKRIPAMKIVEIGSILHKPIMLLGGKDVYEVGEMIVSELGDRAFNGCGKYSLYQSCSILKQADCVITGDTGLMHIAAAFQKPIAVLWGNTIPEFGMYPYMPGQREMFRNFEVCPLACRPCSKLGRKKCPRKHFKCMNNIPAIEVADWVNQF